MRTVTLNQAVTDLKKMIKDTLNNKDVITISTEDGAVTILPQEDYESMQETLKLLTDKKSLQALLKGHQGRNAGYVADSYILEDIFDDIQD